ncbi:DegT/DnrJ/EryC1/StrS aminotransferase family protein [Candidatus Shapirobacteria bacterium]|nr:DegT/DnrJ/EryC1/StrS aminotransferase family protein [Candidatus Shapirobacteria bacterium]
MAKIPLYQPILGEEEEKAILKVIRSRKLSNGLEVDHFEREFARFIGKKYAVAVNSGTSALHHGSIESIRKAIKV